MNQLRSKPRTHRWLLAIGALALQAGAAFWMLQDPFYHRAIPQPTSSAFTQNPDAAPLGRPAILHVTIGIAEAVQPVTLASTLPTPTEPDHATHPHPITPEREALQHELQLIAALNDALDSGDVDHMRELIASYREQRPDDENAMREGYERLADCLEHPGEAARAAGQLYYDTQRASTLRRYVRRTCALDAPAASL